MCRARLSAKQPACSSSGNILLTTPVLLALPSLWSDKEYSALPTAARLTLLSPASQKVNWCQCFMWDKTWVSSVNTKALIFRLFTPHARRSDNTNPGFTAQFCRRHLGYLRSGKHIYCCFLPVDILHWRSTQSFCAVYLLPCLRAMILASFAASLLWGTVASHSPHCDSDSSLSFTIHSWKASKQMSENHIDGFND